jgi:hypothetical protein
MTNLLTAIYMACFAACGWPAIFRMVRRQSSGDLSVWREWLLLVGVCAQFVVMLQTGARWQVLISPVNTFVSVSTALAVIYRYR